MRFPTFKSISITPAGLRVSIFASVVFSCLSELPAQQEITVVREFQLDGFVERLQGDEITVVAADGKAYSLRIQSDPLQPIGLKGGNAALNQPAAISVVGNVSPDVLEEGMTVAIQCDFDAEGRVKEINSVELLPLESEPTGIDADPSGLQNGTRKARVVGSIKSINKKRLVLSVPRHELAPRQKITLNPNLIKKLGYRSQSLNLVRSGDVVDSLSAAELSTGDSVIRGIQINLVKPRDQLDLSLDEQLRLKFRNESDLPNNNVKTWESPERHFLLKSDISDRQANVLMQKLEIMYDLLSKYYGRRPSQPIEVLVVEDFANWDLSEWDPRVINKVRLGEGITVYRRVGPNQQAVVFSANRHDVVQHEAVHGFCYLTFQGTGPLWYAEGIAELGMYWKLDDISVTASPAVIGYLRSRQPQSLKRVINATEIEGEVWKAYAWRWALCHFLAHNPNYSELFRQLGPALMKELPQASFENTYRKQADELTFEYLQFMKDLEAGLRVDLTAWQWDDDLEKVENKPVQRQIEANKGWQSTGAIVERGVTYETRAKGEWKLSSATPPTNADGDDTGRGRLMGVIFKDYKLSDEFELGVDPDFIAPSDGVLYVRCRDRMSLLADNDGEVRFAIRRKE